MAENDRERHHKALLAPLRMALYDFEPKAVPAVLQRLFAPDAAVHLAFPFEDLAGADGLWEQAWQPLGQAFPDLERRDTIVLAGRTQAGADWVGCCGYYTGTFARPFLDIPPTGHQASLRFHEFYRFADDRVVEFQALWDLPELMMQAGAWPLAPSLGREWHVPAPATQDGLAISANAAQSQASFTLVKTMLEGLAKFAQGGVDAMRLPDYWHPRMSWYGPSGIGTCRGISGFRNWHQIPFLNAMP
ncbi:MAG: polyketide cyclase, partial [Alphaproteobacteria bacterium]